MAKTKDVKDKEVKLTPKGLVEQLRVILLDESIPPENKLLLYQQGFIAGALSVMVLNDGYEGHSKEILNDLTMASIESYSKIIEYLKDKKCVSKIMKFVKENG